MDSKFVIVLILTWLIFMVCAIVNGVIRNTVFKPMVGEQTAHQISTIVFMTIIFILTYIVLRYSSLKISDSETLLIGGIWLVLTIAFEFLAGHYAFGNSWEHLLADYNILKGRIWSLVLVTIFLSPYLSNKLL